MKNNKLIKLKLTAAAILAGAIFMLLPTGSAFAVDHSGNLREGAAVTATATVNGVPVAGAGTYTYNDWDVSQGGNESSASPHGGFSTATVKCSICHSAHNAAPGSNPVGSNQTADTLLRTRANQACSYCHVIAGGTVTGTSISASMAAGDCISCHGGVHSEKTPGNLDAIHVSNDASANISVGLDNSDHDLTYGVQKNCSDCHSMNLLPLHGNYCDVCHSSTNENVVNAISTGNANCISCHTKPHAEANPVHENIYYNGCTCHDVNWDDPGESCAICHTASTPSPQPSTTSDVKDNYINTAVITLTASDNLKDDFGINATYYILDEQAKIKGTKITVPPPTSGTETHTLKFWSTDWSGNTENVNTVTFTVSADTSPPATSSNVIANKIYAGNQVFNLTANDVSSFVDGTWWQLDGTQGTWTKGKTIAVAAPLSGTVAHTLYFYSRDGLGNIEPIKSVSFSVLSGKDFPAIKANQNFVVPSGVSTLSVTLTAGSGGGNYYGSTWQTGGLGGRVTAVIPVTAGQSLTIRTGSRGMDYVYGGDGQVHTFGGWPNGGNGGVGNTSQGGGGGGGSSSILLGSNVLVEAGAGGGAGYGLGGAGGAQGTGVGGNQTGGNGNIIGGGGGGGWNSGTAGNWLTNGGRGGFGGTSYIAIGSGALDVGVNNGDGFVAIRYSIPSTDTIPPVTTSSLNPGNNENYTSPQHIILSASDASSGILATYYKIDDGEYILGSDFTISSVGAHTFSYYSVDNANNIENVHTSNQFFINDGVSQPAAESSSKSSVEAAPDNSKDSTPNSIITTVPNIETTIPNVEQSIVATETTQENLPLTNTATKYDSSP